MLLICLEDHKSRLPFGMAGRLAIAGLLYDETGQREKALKHMETAALIWENADPEYKPAKLMREKLAKLKAIEL